MSIPIFDCLIDERGRAALMSPSFFLHNHAITQILRSAQKQDYIAFIEAKVADQIIAEEIKIPIVLAQKAFVFSILKR